MSKAVKILVLGQIGVGKTVMVKSLCGSPANLKEASTISLSIESTIYKETKLVFWDVAGATSIEEINLDVFKGSHAILYVCDFSRPSTLDGIEEVLDWISEQAPNVPLIVVGNKKDTIEEDSLNQFLADFKSVNMLSFSVFDENSRDTLLRQLNCSLT